MSREIRQTRAEEAPLLLAIEVSASAAFRRIKDLAWIADDNVMSVKEHQDHIMRGTSWVAVDSNDKPIGFLCVKIRESSLHICEVSVHFQYQGLGIGRRLIEHILHHAQINHLKSITLTTFRDIKFNELFYKRLGFMILGKDDLDDFLHNILQQEVVSGLDPKKRCAMSLKVN